MNLFTGISSLILGFVALALAISWLVFPWLVLNSLNKILAQLRAGNGLLAELRTIARGQFSAGPPEPGEEACYYLAVRGETTGPFTRAHLEASLQRGLIDAQTPAIKKGEKTWSIVGDVLAAK